jgi:hypothetical protein
VFPVDGRIAGLWRLDLGKNRLPVVFVPFAKIATPDRTALTAEAEALARFTDHDREEISFQCV